jgi:hypothetical protein
MKRKVGLFLLVGAMLPLGVASTAWACAALATLSLDSKVVQPGQEVNITGRGFSDSHAGTTAGDSRVALRMRTRNGAVVKELEVFGGRIATKMALPRDMKSGFYVMLATQQKADGTARAGTPARFAFRVSGAPVAQSAVASPWSSAPSGPSSSASVAGGGLGSQTLLVGGILSLTLLAAGSVLVGRKNHTMTLGV